MMEVKKFEAPTLAQALQVIKRELGPEAIVISTKHNRSNFGLMNKASVEVTAAVAKEALEKKRKAEERMTPEQREALYDGPAQKVIQAYDVLSGSRLQREMAKKPAETNASSLAMPQQRPLTARRYVDIQDDDSAAEMAADFKTDRPKIRTQSTYAQKSVTPPSEGLLPRLLAMMIDSGIEQDLVKEIGDEMKALMIREHITKWEILKLQLAQLLMNRIRVAKPLSERLRNPGNPRVITFVGPTGVGKTTTIAKIAAELVIHQKKPVVLATTDTYKIAAVEQLQTYAQILKIPLEVCPSAESFAMLATQIASDQVVLVDTAGFGPRDDAKLSELKDILNGVRMETHLCISATTRDRDLKSMYQRFQIFEPDFLVVTKADETQFFGNVFSLAARTRAPLSYFTMGQRVPEDMEVATKERLADWILHIGQEVS